MGGLDASVPRQRCRHDNEAEAGHLLTPTTAHHPNARGLPRTRVLGGIINEYRYAA